jgi:N-acetylglucosaminyl-diphospho-decaprenol L-rhamnosyltransferase
LGYFALDDLGIVIVNYRTPRLLRECLTSVFAGQGDLTYQVCVVDNGSQDESCDLVETEFPQVQLVASEINGGYPYANNLGLTALGFGLSSASSPAAEPPPRYALLLNPDTVVPPTALCDMVAFLDARPDAAVAGPKLVRQDGSLDLACRRSFPSPQVSFYRLVGLGRLFPKSPRFGRYNMTFLDSSLTAEVDSVVGAFMMVRREAILQVGLLDERFFMYGEDLDWALRMKRAGWKVYYNAAVTVLHYKEAASRHSRKARYEFYRAMYLFYQKHYAATTPAWLGMLVVLGIVLRGGLAMATDVLRGPAQPVLTGGERA